MRKQKQITGTEIKLEVTSVEKEGGRGNVGVGGGKRGPPEGPQRPGTGAGLGCFPICSAPSHLPLIMSRALCQAARARPFTGADFRAQPRPGNFPSKGLLFSMQFLFFQFFKDFVTEILKHVRK